VIIVDDLRAMSRSQRAAFTAAFLGWALDAFDFFLLTFVLTDIARDFKVEVPAVAVAIALTLYARPFGALVFGLLADRFGRRAVLQIDVMLYSLLAFASAFSPNLITLLILRTAFGFAMGGEWGVGASLTMESVPPRMRGMLSGMLQVGYPTGALLGALANLALPHVGWRGLLMFSALPALLVLYIRRNVEESPSWVEGQAERRQAGVLGPLIRHWPLLIYVVVLMTAFNLFSHGTQDLFPTFLKKQHHFDTVMVTTIAICGNIGAICGGIFFGTLSEVIGRRRAILLAALFALPVIPLWAFSQTPLLLAAGAFLIQISVQGAWGVVPVHLNELSPDTARGFFPGFAYQLGNLFAASAAPLQAAFAHDRGDNYGLALGVMAAGVAVTLSILTIFGPESRGKAFGAADSAKP
jgi:SHS family lactate transporter-like MFS transporter